MATQSEFVLQVDNITKDLKLGEVTVHILRGITLNVKRGEVLGIIGPSGSGKSTLLGIIGGLDSPTTGKVYLDGQDVTNLNERKLTTVRNEKIGFVFQQFNLIPTLTAQENVSLPIQFSKTNKNNPDKRAKALLTTLGLGDRLKHRPNQLSGGQQQRVAIARALANEPPLLLCDEPTGNLDTESGERVMAALQEIRETLNATVVIVTHDMEVASQCDRVVTLIDGEIASDVDPRSTAQRAGVKMLKDKRATDELSALAKE
ncbi:MAG: ABC transporter ATP-binding protein [Aggregatilineales bacterium]